jgi:VWFA-related protein
MSCLTLALALGVFVPARSQDAPPTLPSAGATVLQVVARRIAVDVVVTDSKGHPVRGLTRDDFKVFEDGTPQSVRSFDPHVLEHTTGPAQLNKPLDLPPHTYANLVRAPEDGPVTVLLYDVLNTPTQAMPYAHQAMVKFLKSQPPGSRTAIFVLSDKLHMLQGFTDDETRLLTAINGKSAGTQQSTYLLNAANSGAPTTDLANDQPQGPVDPSATGPTSVLAEMNSMEQMEQLFQLQERLDLTVNAFAEIARFLSALPGRKNLLWLSGSFPGSILPDADPAANGTSASFGMTLDSEREMKIANDLLNAAHVSVYPVDVRGLQVDPAFSAASNAKTAPVKSTFSNQLNAEHSTMDDIADNTGGHAFYNTNGLTQAMQEARDQGSVYYTLTYSPSNGNFNGAMRHIRVQLDKTGYQLSYRRNYFADATNPAGNIGVLAANAVAPAAPVDPLTNSMRHGAPISTELFFLSSVLPVGEVADANPKELAQLSQFAASPKKNAATQASVIKVQHYEIDYSILGRMLDMPPINNGKFGLSLEFAAAAFNGDGLLLNGLSVQVKQPLSAAEHDSIKVNGYRTKLNIALPLDARWMRIAVRDAASGQTGSIEIPAPASVAAKP